MNWSSKHVTQNRCAARGRSRHLMQRSEQVKLRPRLLDPPAECFQLFGFWTQTFSSKEEGKYAIWELHAQIQATSTYPTGLEGASLHNTY